MARVTTSGAYPQATVNHTFLCYSFIIVMYIDENKTLNIILRGNYFVLKTQWVWIFPLGLDMET